MEYITKLLGLTSAILLALGLTETSQAPTPPTTSTSTTVVTTTTVEPTPTTTANSNGRDSAHNRCGQWWGLAQDIGWEAKDMPTLDYIMWRESRCDPTQHNTTLNADGSTDIGLTQINDRSWCLPTRWYPEGYLQTVGVLTKVGCTELFDPAINLKAAKALYDYSKENNGNGFEPWKV